MLQLVATCSLRPCGHMHILPPSARSMVSRCSAALCMLGRCSTPSQVLGEVGRCTIRKHSACSHRPPRTDPPHAPRRPQLSTCSASCESGRSIPQSSTIAMRYSPQTTFRPHAGSPHAAAGGHVLAAAMAAHAHCAPLSTIEGLEVFRSTLHARALQHTISGSG